MVDGLPWRQVVGQEPPSAARPQPVQHRVEQLAALVDGWPPAGLGLGDQGAQDLPVGVGQVGAVAAASQDAPRGKRDGEALQPTASSEAQMTFSDAL